MFYYERKYRLQGYDVVIGVDEVGIGPLAGPVVAAAVVLQSTRFRNRIDDSKKLTALQREKAFLEITEKSLFGIGIVNEKIIDRLNILGATRIAMEEAVGGLVNELTPSCGRRIIILVDGTIKPDFAFPRINIIKGDGKSKSIASASIIAKVTRDRIMCVYDKIYPDYGFLRHKGYPTQAHRNAVKKFGRTSIHRTSFYCG
jgi:ribonuclease HII